MMILNFLMFMNQQNFKSQHSQKSGTDPPEENGLEDITRLHDLMLYCSMTRLESS